jgi:hypothetical protein
MLNPEISIITADLVGGALASLDGSFGLQIQRQVGELNRDIVSELETPQRNTFRLLGLFNGLSTFVQTLGAVPAAYSEIQSIATALGLM